MSRRLLVILAVAFVLRIVAIATANHLGYGPIRGDAITYHGLAQSLAEGRGYLHNGRYDNVRVPLYPLALSLIYRVCGTNPIAGAVAQAGFDLAAVASLAWLTRMLTGSIASAHLAALGLALWPGAILMNLVLYTEPLFTWLLILATGATVQMERSGRARWGVASGVLFGLCTMTRQTTAAFLPALLVVAQIFRGSAIAGAWRARTLALILYLATLAPWTARELIVNGRVGWTRAYSGLNLWIGNHLPWEGRAIDRAALAKVYERLGDRANDEHELNRALIGEALASMRAHPLETAWLWAKKTWRFLFVDLRPHHLWMRLALSAVLALLYLAAFRGALALPNDRGAAVFVISGVFAFFLAIHVVTYSQMRFAEPVRPFAIALAAHGVVAWRGRRTESRDAADDRQAPAR